MRLMPGLWGRPSSGPTSCAELCEGCGLVSAATSVRPGFRSWSAAGGHPVGSLSRRWLASSSPLPASCCGGGPTTEDGSVQDSRCWPCWVWPMQWLPDRTKCRDKQGRWVSPGWRFGVSGDRGRGNQRPFCLLGSQFCLNLFQFFSAKRFQIKDAA